jgi:hypothetical protein
MSYTVPEDPINPKLTLPTGIPGELPLVNLMNEVPARLRVIARLVVGPATIGGSESQ